MRAMYASPSGNPDLLSETGTIWELGFTYNKEFFITGSLFLTRFKDMIDSVRLPQYDFQRRFFNIAEAHINGLELQLQKSIQHLALTMNYTFLDHWNENDERPLDALSKHNLNFDLQAFPIPQFRIQLLGLLASSSSWLDSWTNTLVNIPAYFNLDTILSYKLGQVELFTKMTNVFDQFTFTEPGFPWRGRYIEFGIKADILK
jgi:iron complex outermembrane receptor protein